MSDEDTSEQEEETPEDESPEDGESGSDKKEETEESEEKDGEDKEIAFASYQAFVFVSCYVGYMLFLYNRKSFAFTLPHVIMEEYFTSYEVSIILTTQTITYTISKFCAGIMCDKYSPRLMFAVGMFATGFFMVGFTDNDDVVNLTLLAFFNGIAQGFGWPPAAKMVRAWYPPTQFGFWWALLSTSTNVAGAIGPPMATFWSINHGWRTAIQMPAVVTIIVSFFIYFTTFDKPSDVGYEDQLTLGGAEQGHWSDLLGSEFMMILGSSYAIIFLIKTSCQDWGQLFLLQERGLPAYTASTFLSSMEIGGIFGALVAGAATDHMVRKGYYFGTGKSPRMIVVQVFVASAACAMNLFLFSITAYSSSAWISFVGFLLGFFLYGGISLFGTIAVETAPIHMTGCAHAIIGFAANTGAIVAGIPVNAIASAYDWATAFLMLNALCLLVFFILVIGKDVKATFLQSGSGPPKLSKKAE